MRNLSNEGGSVDKEVIRYLAKQLAAGNADLELLLDWSGRTKKSVLDTLNNDQEDAAKEIMFSVVNQKCGTNLKRCDLEATSGYWDIVPVEIKNRLKSEADILRTNVQKRIGEQRILTRRSLTA
jgi:hypothetical protein